MDAALSRVLDKTEDARFWEGVRADYARLQADPEEWADYVGELAEGTQQRVTGCRRMSGPLRPGDVWLVNLNPVVGRSRLADGGGPGSMPPGSGPAAAQQ